MKSGHAENLMREIEDCSMRDGGIIPLLEIFNIPGEGRQDKGRGEYRGAATAFSPKRGHT